MKTLLASVLALSAAASFAQNKPVTQTYKVDTSASKIVYEGKKITGSHTGNVNPKNGHLTFQGEDIIGGEITVDMNTITSTDLTDKEMNAKYVGHMKSADFFNVEKHPEAKIVIKDSKKTKEGLQVTGDMTFVGKTNPVTFLVRDLKKTDSLVTGKSNLKLNRTKWGLVYGSSSFIKGLGDKAISDEFTLAIDLTAKK